MGKIAGAIGLAAGLTLVGGGGYVAVESMREALLLSPSPYPGNTLAIEQPVEELESLVLLTGAAGAITVAIGGAAISQAVPELRQCKDKN